MQTVRHCGHLHIMYTLFIALSALVSRFSAGRGSLLMTGFMDYGKSSSSTAVRVCLLLSVVASGFQPFVMFF